MNIGLVDVDGHNFPNFALMRLSACYKAKGHRVEWAAPRQRYDIAGRLPEAVENSRMMDYSIYPEYPFSLQFFSRGCIRKCPFCLVREKEGYIQTVEPVELNPKGKWIEVLDNNFFANPQ